MRYAPMVLMVLITLSSAWAADTTYRDQRQPSFTLLVPDGWTASRTDQGVSLRHGESTFELGIMSGTAQPGAVLVQIRPQLESQWKEFREVDAGRVTFGGLNGAYAVYAGVPPSGSRSFQRVVTMTNGRMTFIAFASAPADEYEAVKPQLDRIERSFSPDPVR
jgi:hypothetical protein